MDETRIDVLVGGPPETAARRRPADRLVRWGEHAAPVRGAGTAGGMVPTDDDLIERTLAFSGSYVSDDGQVTIERSSRGSSQYSGARFVGHCHVCSIAGSTAAADQPLSDVHAAARFVAAHDHGNVD
jgi:hypothetical protein